MKQAMRYEPTTVTAHLGSMTTALAAQQALAAAAVRSEIVKEDSGTRGCGYALTFPRTQLGNVRTILSAAHINVRRYEEN